MLTIFVSLLYTVIPEKMETIPQSLNLQCSFWNQYIFLLGDGRLFFVWVKRSFVGILKPVYFVFSTFGLDIRFWLKTIYL